MDFSIYNKKKVFLTGHTGFKGAWMLVLLKQLGAIVKGYSLEPEQNNDLFNIINGGDFCDSIISDIRDVERLKSEIKSFEPDFIFHFAAQALVRKSYELPFDTFEINLMGTLSILESVVGYSKKCSVILVTTDKVYENKEWLYPYRENDRLGGFDPYSASKACAELAINCYRNSFFNLSTYDEHQKGIASVRSGNVIGGGDWSQDRIIPDIVNSVNNNEKIIIRNPLSVRPWQHVLDPLVGYLMLGKKLYTNPKLFSDSWNFGPLENNSISVMELVKIAILEFGKGEYEINQDENAPHEAKLLRLDISKSSQILNWEPVFSSRKAINLTINWYKKYYQNQIDPLSLMENDIKIYFSEKNK